MQIDTQNMFGGPLSWDRITTKQSDIDKATLSRIRKGKEGFGPDAARKAADVTGEEAAHIYLATQTRSIKARRDGGDLDDGGVLKAVGRVLRTLKEEFPGAMISKEEATALQDLAAQASKSGAAPVSQMETLGRDGSGQRVTKSAVGEAEVPGIYGKLGRNADGTARKRAM